MMYLIARMLQPLIYPDTLATLGLIAAFVFYAKGRRPWAIYSFISAFVLLIVPSVPIVSWSLMHYIERAYPSRPIGEYPEAGAIVVLGGTASRVALPRHESEEIGGSRLLPAARLYHRKKAKLILVSGGDPYRAPDGSQRSQALDMRDVIRDMGVPEEDIVLQAESRNTDEDMLFSAQKLQARGIRKALLVTSAFHMRRAMLLGQRTGMEWIPVPTGHEAPMVGFTWRSFVPAWGGINDTDRAIKEIVGLQYARFRLTRRKTPAA